MNKEELELYVKKSCENILKQLAENPKEMFDLLELQDKYNNLLKEKIELKRQIKKKNEVIDKAIEYISNKKAIINTDVIRIFDLFEIDEQGYTNELLNILKGDSNDC